MANPIIRKPYVYGGGHKPYSKRTVGMITRGSFMRWGRRGKGRWITGYTNPGHAYVVIGGLRLDTSRGERLAPGSGAAGGAAVATVQALAGRVYGKAPEGL